MLTDKELEEIRRKLLELEQEPPADGWKSINSEIHPPDNKWKPIWWLGAVLLLLLTGIGGYLILDKKAETPKQLTTEKQIPSSIGSGDESEEVKVPILDSASDNIREGVSQTKQPEDQSKTADVGRTTNNIPNERMPKEGKVVNSVNQPAKLLNSGIDLSLPPVTQDSVQRAKTIRSQNQESHTLPLAVKDSVGRKPTGNVPGIVDRVVKAPRDSVKKESPFVALQSAAADSAAFVASVDSSRTEEEPAKKAKKKKAALSNPSGWAVGAYFAPRYAFRKFSPNAEDKILITNLNTNNQLDPERLGYEMGLSVSKAVKSNLSLEGGLSLINLKEDVDYIYTLGVVESSIMRQASDGSIIVEAIQKSEERQLVSSYTYGGLRIGINYYVLQTPHSRINLSFAGGMNLLLKGKTKEYRNGEWIETIVFPDKNNLLEQSNYNLQAGVGYNVALHPKYELTVMPALNYFLGSTFKEREPFGLRPYTLGVNLQVKRSLGW